jgi:hypothetical protein
VQQTNSNNEETDSNLNNASEWKKYELRKFPSPVGKLAWDENGCHLGVSTSDGITYTFKEQTEGVWELIAMTNTEGIMEEVVENADQA